MTESSLILAALWLVAYPACAASISIPFGGLTALCEEVTFKEGFLFTLMTMTFTDIPLTDFAPTGHGGMAITVVLSIVQLLVLVLFVGLSAGPIADPFVDALRLTPPSAKEAFIKHVSVYVLGFPTICLVWSIVGGGLLAASENWPYVDGFVMVLGEVTATHIVLEDTPPPDTEIGKVVGLYVGIVGVAILACFIAVGGVPLLGFGLTFDRSPIIKRLPWRLVLNSEQKEALGLTTGLITESTDKVAPAAASAVSSTSSSTDVDKLEIASPREDADASVP